eukprot:3584010-Prymnesium_polylepis.2
MCSKATVSGSPPLVPFEQRMCSKKDPARRSHSVVDKFGFEVTLTKFPFDEHSLRGHITFADNFALPADALSTRVNVMGYWTDGPPKLVKLEHADLDPPSPWAVQEVLIETNPKAPLQVAIHNTNKAQGRGSRAWMPYGGR